MIPFRQLLDVPITIFLNNNVPQQFFLSNLFLKSSIIPTNIYLRLITLKMVIIFPFFSHVSSFLSFYVRCHPKDTFLPHVECGTIILIGATTENPSFQVNSALLSRCKVLVLEKLSVEAMSSILDRAVAALRIRVLEQDTMNPEDQDQAVGQE